MKKALIFCLILLLAFIPVKSFAGFEYHATILITGPSTCYEGHSIQLRDSSNYNCGSTEGASSNNGAFLTAQNGFIKTTWHGNYDPVAMNSYYGNVVEPVIRYNQVGSDIVTLESTWLKGPLTGETKTAQKSISILPCPYLDSYEFTGEKRSCRKQTLSFSIAQHPSFPIKTISIEIPGAYTDNFNYSEDENKEYINGSIDFIAKNETAQNFSCTIYAEDIRGNVLSKELTVFVAADLNPFAFINSDTLFYRNKNGVAAISADALISSSDDLPSYLWNLTDESDQSINANGSANESSVTYNLNKPGKYTLSLTATDSWDISSLGSLAKYISQSDIKSSVSSKTITVDNIAPTVSLGKIEEEKAEAINANILLLNYEGDTNALKNQLANQNILATIHGEITPDKSEAAGDLKLIGSFQTTYLRGLSQNNKDSHFYEGAVFCDDDYVYRLMANVSGVTPIEPYYVLRYELADLSKEPVQISISDPNYFASLFQSDIQIPLSDGTFPVYDSNGNVNYSFTYSISGKNTTIKVTRLKDNASVSKTISGNYAGHISFAMELGDGRIVFGLGADKYITMAGKMNQPSPMSNPIFTDFATGSSSAYPKISTYLYGFQKGNTLLLTYAHDSISITYVYELTKGYNATLSQLQEKYFDENATNIFIDANDTAVDVNTICEILGISDAGESTAGSETLNFNYYDAEGDPFLKAKYVYDGKTYYTDSLSISIDKVPSCDTLYFYVMDNTGNEEYNKYSKPLAVLLTDMAGDGGGTASGEGESGSGAGNSESGSGSGGENEGDITQSENPLEDEWAEFYSLFSLHRRF